MNGIDTTCDAVARRCGGQKWPRRGAVASLLLIALMAALASAAMADRHRRGPPGGPPPPGRIFEVHGERLGLTPEASAAIQAIVETSRKEDEALREQLHDAHRKLGALLDAETPDKEAVLAQSETISALELLERQSRLRAMMAIRALLTPEQRRELVNIREERSDRPPRGRGRGPLGPCREDLAKRCPEARGSDVLACLAKDYEGLSDRCQGMLEDPMQEEKPGRHGPPGGGGMGPGYRGGNERP